LRNGNVAQSGGQPWWATAFGVAATVLVAWPALALQNEITGKDGAAMVLVPAGEFMMGSNERDDDEEPVHPVYLDAFYMETAIPPARTPPRR